MTDALALFAAIASAIATFFVAYASWRAPRAAAQLAETLRRAAENVNERNRQKFFLLATLMQERSAVYTENAVRAFNMIDIVFHDVKPVREAWAELYLTFNNQQIMQGPGHDDKLRQLLAAMAADLGLGDIRSADLSRVYIPHALGQERLIRDLERQQSLARLQGNTSPSANTAPQTSQLFPPKPSS